MEQWSNYFMATAGAAAALTGLIFVAVSLNLQRILSMKHLPSRALGSLILLVNVLVISSFTLIPNQPILYLGCEILVVDIILWGVCLSKDIAMVRNTLPQYKINYLRNLAFTQVAMVPYLIAGFCMCCKSAAGFYWLIPAITFSIIKSLIDSWVLLVEINR